MTKPGDMMKRTALAGIGGGILVEAVLFCAGSLALGVSTLQWISFFLAGSIVPIVLGVTGAYGAVRLGAANPMRIAFFLGILGTIAGPVLDYVFQMEIPGSTALARTLSVVLFLLISGVMSQIVIIAVFQATSYLLKRRL